MIPRVFRNWMKHHLPHQDGESLSGCLEILYEEMAAEKGGFKAKIWLLGEIIQSIPGVISAAGYWRFAMLLNYFKIAIRQMRRQKLYTLINMVGLSVGMACFLIITLFIRGELRFEDYHENRDRIYRVCAHIQFSQTDIRHTASNAVTAGELKATCPEVEETVRFRGFGTALVEYEGKRFNENHLTYADESAFDIFTWPLIAGDASTALAAPWSIVLTSTAAEKFFGNEDPVGKVLRINQTEAYTVTGVMEPMPYHSVLDYNGLVSMKTLYQKLGDQSPVLTGWTNFNFETYLLFNPGVDAASFEKKIRLLLHEKAGEALEAKGAHETLFLQPLKDIYLRNVNGGGPILYVYIFSAVALFVLFIACVNYMNLATARSAGRAREVGMRKTLGAGRHGLASQFLSESLLLSFVSGLVALFFTALLLPPVRELTHRPLSLSFSENGWLYWLLLGVILFVTIAAGSYPAFFLSRFKPVQVLRGRLRSGSSNIGLRRVLVVIQFVVSITLIISTGLIRAQLNFLRDKNPGFDKENVLIFSLTDEKSRQSLEVLKEAFRSNSRVLAVGVSSTLPGWGSASNEKIPEGYTRENTPLMDDINVDEDFIPAMGMEIVEGRNFSREFGADMGRSVIINETAARAFGWDEPIGKTIRTTDIHNMAARGDMGWTPKRVIGVVKDFHLRGMSTMINPLFIDNEPEYPFAFNRWRYLSVKVQPDDFEETVAFLKLKMKEVLPNKPFEYRLLSETFDRQFRSVERSRNLLFAFTFIAILIACLGLFGMSAYTAEQRTKEIGIRKVLGGSESGIVALLSRQLLAWVVLANGLAWPVSYVLLNRWLQNFPYRTAMKPSLFILSTVAAVALSFLTISFHAVKAARVNPAKSLKCE